LAPVLLRLGVQFYCAGKRAASFSLYSAILIGLFDSLRAHTLRSPRQQRHALLLALTYLLRVEIPEAGADSYSVTQITFGSLISHFVN